MHELYKIRASSEPVMEYVEASREKAPRLHEQYETYRLDKEAVAKIRCHSDRYLVVYSAPSGAQTATGMSPYWLCSTGRRDSR